MTSEKMIFRIIYVGGLITICIRNNMKLGAVLFEKLYKN